MGKKSIKGIIFNKRERILFSLICGFLISLIFSVYSTYKYSEKIQKNIADNIVRFHVLANSNNIEDIELKYKVRDSLIKYTNNIARNCKDRDEFISIINKNINNIKENVDDTLMKNGSNYETNIYFSNDIFPYKKYNNISFPAGEYLGLRVEIGEAKGDNWWCVMFPSICFTDETISNIDLINNKNIENVIGKEEYDIISYSSSNNIVPKIKFKIVELWQEFKYKDIEYITNDDK